jgi:uncharacterized membrane protein
LDYIRKEIERLTLRIEDMKSKGISSSLRTELSKCEDMMDLIKSQMNIENYIDAKNNVQVADDCIDDIEQRAFGFFSFNIGYLFWIVIGLLLIIMILVLVVIIVIYKVSRKHNKPKTLKLSKGGANTQIKPYLEMNERMIEENSYKDRLKRIEEKLKG